MTTKALQIISILVLLAGTHLSGQYVCVPCDAGCGTLNFAQPGICPHCKMKLMLKSSSDTTVEKLSDHFEIKPGAGKFIYKNAHTGKQVVVHYYLPGKFTRSSSVIFIIPGAGCNGNNYRDAWVPHAEKYNLLVLSPEYPGITYPVNATEKIPAALNKNNIFTTNHWPYSGILR